MRTWYPACKRDLRTAKPTKPVLPVIWDWVLGSNQADERGKKKKRVTNTKSPAIVNSVLTEDRRVF
jgi:hypothetical protein